ncbi:hypothetical protein QG516_26320 [Pedobacter gandavensis]|uniref:hypothetical protein n=1 Tax=Pedobacter TaxID=84567 RepID=UPI001C9A2BA8|nr:MULTISPECIES: hypothetical protein [Pedobacter]WGQ10032.1 hypothetical protein QG516_26320 [Pedobacter gandavensis]
METTNLNDQDWEQKLIDENIEIDPKGPTIPEDGEDDDDDFSEDDDDLYIDNSGNDEEYGEDEFENDDEDLEWK